MDEKDSYLTCLIIIAISFVLIIGILVFFSLTKDDFLKEGKIQILTRTSTTEEVINTRRTTANEEYYGTATIKKISKINGSRNATVDFDNPNNEYYYISKSGNHELILRSSDSTQWEFGEEDTCITYTRNDGNSYKFNADNCDEESELTVIVTEDNKSKKYIIANEKRLEISYNGKTINGNVKLEDDLIEFTTNIDVEWVSSDENGLTYTDISETNIQFKLNSLIKLLALTQGGQEIEISFTN